jgi:hypothetical protein
VPLERSHEFPVSFRSLTGFILAASLSFLPAVEAADAPSERPAAGRARVLSVGYDKKFLTPSVAARFAKDGDVIEIDAGNYDGDAAVWTQNNLTIHAVRGRAHLRANGAHAEGKGIWVVKGNNVTIENVEFSGAKVADGNGAGIRLQGANLTLRNCSFHDNETGLLTGHNRDSEILIEHSEFARNGTGKGRTHNIYVGQVKSFTLRYSYVRHAIVGHNVKTRAAENYVLYNRIMDEQTGNSSYLIDFSNGGRAYVIGNLLQQGPRAENYTLLSYSAEGLKHSVNALYVVNNTFVNERPEGGNFISIRPGADEVKIVNNIFVGRGSVPVQARQNNLTLARPDHLADPARFDYRLTSGSRAIDAGTDPGAGKGFNLRPEAESVHPMRKRQRPLSGEIDMGAYEYAARQGR